MIDNFVKAWDENKGKLEEYFKTNEQSCYNNYRLLVELLFTKVINPYLDKIEEDVFNENAIHVIDDGNYQGTLLFLIPENKYQPSPYDYVWTNQYYGSCSGCDALMGISNYDDDVPNEEQVKDYMTLCLHLLQRCNYMIEREK
jgi:hypothetical protein